MDNSDSTKRIDGATIDESKVDDHKQKWHDYN